MDSTLSILQNMIGYHKPVDFRTFCSSPDFCDNPYIYEYWVSNLEVIPDSCNELLLDGALGGGKSYAAAYYFCYRVYLLFVNGDPRPMFGLDPGSGLFCVYFSVSVKMAEKQGFKYLYEAFKVCKWFKNNHPIDENLTSCIKIPDLNFEIDFGSSFGHQIGLNIWGFILDEGNFRKGVGEGMVEEYEEVTDLYEQLLQRQESRFATKDGINGLAILISSASYQSSFTEKRKAIIAKIPSAYNITSVPYKIKPEQYSKETFTVFIGAGAVDPCIIDTDAQKQDILRKANLIGTGQEDSYFVEVPVSTRSHFEANIAMALQNIAGVAVAIKGRFMTNMHPYYDAINKDLKPYFVNNVLIASTDDDTELIEYLIPDNIVYPERPHTIFIDLSVGYDTGGIACYRFDGKNERGQTISTKVFHLSIKPPQYPAQTRITKYKDFIVDLASVINIVAVGSDQYQSTSLRQEIQADLNIEDIRISIDSSDVPHLNWQRALVDKRVTLCYNEIEEREIKEAQHDLRRHRVYKAKGSTDDMFQSDVGAHYLCETVGSTEVDIKGLYGSRMNLVGKNQQEKILRRLGYTIN